MGRRLLSAEAAGRLLRHNPSQASESGIEFCEEEVWATLAFSSDDSRSAQQKQVADSADFQRHMSGLSKALEGGASVAMSAPVAAALPEWRQMSMEHLDSTAAMNKYEAEGEWVPSHEYLSRENWKSTATSGEGAGRTLKGRDLSRFRDAIWSRTGFLG